MGRYDRISWGRCEGIGCLVADLWWDRKGDAFKASQDVRGGHIRVDDVARDMR